MDFKIKNLLLVFFFFFSTMNSSSFDAFQQKCINTRNNFCDFLADYVGYQDLSPENEKFVRDVLQEMRISHPVTIRRMSKKAIQIYGFHNAIVYFNYLFVSEDWFNTLTVSEKRFLIAHEAVHIKEKHTLKQIVVGGLLFFVSQNLSSTINRRQGLYQDQNNEQLCQAFLFTLPYLYFKRKLIEQQADLQAAETLGNAADGVCLVERWKRELLDDESSYALWRLVSWFEKNILFYFASTHPSLDERQNYLTVLAQKQKKEDLAFN